MEEKVKEARAVADDVSRWVGGGASRASGEGMRGIRVG